MNILNPKNLPDSEDIEKFFSDFSNLENHQNYIEMVKKIVEKVPEVESLFLGGSLALESGDIFSDIDIYVMVSNMKDLEQVKLYIIDEIKRLTYIIHAFDSMANPNDLIIYLRPFIKLDLSFKDFEKISKSWRIGSASKIIYDRNGLGKRALQMAKNIRFDIKKHDSELRNFAIAFPSLCYNLAGYIIRGEYVTSLDFFAWMRRKLMRLSGFLLGMWDEGTRKAEKRFPKEIIDLYHKIQIDNQDEIWENFDILIEWFTTFIIPQLNQKAIPHSGEEIDTLMAILRELESKL